MAKVRLKNKQWSGFSSYLGVTKFENGVSVSDVTEREAQLLGSITAVEMIDDEGNAIGNAGFGQVNVDKRGNKAPVEKKKIMASDTFDTKEIEPTPDVKVVHKAKDEDETDQAEKDLEAEIEDLDVADEDGAEEVKVYTREELEALADEQGIAGLRAVGEARNVRSNSIDSLINKILKAQE